MERQPIETAPKDGTEVLGVNANADPRCRNNVIWWRAEHGEWYSADMQPFTPTHWMPLAPPGAGDPDPRG